ncbi:MAG: tetratricopeptide repeat protein [Bacteroidota bacterium]|nr:tetratricopeptide repeat protein [Bacteroidota bacterium]
MNLETLKEQLDKASKGQEDISAFYSALWLTWTKLSYIKDEQLQQMLHTATVLSVTPQNKALTILTEGLIHTLKSNFKKAVFSLNEAIDMFNELKEDGGKGVANCFLIICYRSLGQLDKAQNNLNEALRLLKDIKRESMYGTFLTITYYQAGELCITYKKYDQAKEHFNNGLAYEKTDLVLRSRMLSGLGGVHLQTQEWEDAIDYFNQSLELIKGLDNFLLEAKIYTDIGNYYLKKNELEQALSYQHKSLQIREDNNLASSAITNYIQLANLYFRQKDITKAIKYGELAVEKAGEYNLIPKLYEAHHILAEICESTGDIQKAFTHFKDYARFKEEVHSQEISMRISQISSQHEMEIMQQQKEIVRLRNVELKSALDEINESFRYAGRIQKAILPPTRQILKYLPEHFIIYKPKDIVAGDFYWLEVADDCILIAAADCTGHGVPGAMVSVVCHNALNRAVREFNLKTPGEILDKTTELVIEQFEKSDDDVKDGMDIALCCIKGNKLQFSGANNPLWILRNGEILETKGTKQPVGKHTERKPFVTHEIELKKEDVIYLLTDGYADQFGGEKGKKYGSKKIKELVLSMGMKPMKEQELILTNNFDFWKNKLEQVDDVCVIGIKI